MLGPWALAALLWTDIILALANEGVVKYYKEREITQISLLKNLQIQFQKRGFQSLYI